MNREGQRLRIAFHQRPTWTDLGRSLETLPHVLPPSEAETTISIESEAEHELQDEVTFGGAAAALN